MQDKEESDADYLDNPVASTSEVAVQGRLYSASSSSTTTSHALQVSAVQDEVESDNDYLDNPVFSTSKFAIQGRSRARYRDRLENPVLSTSKSSQSTNITKVATQDMPQSAGRKPGSVKDPTSDQDMVPSIKGVRCLLAAHLLSLVVP